MSFTTTTSPLSALAATGRWLVHMGSVSEYWRYGLESYLSSEIIGPIWGERYSIAIQKFYSGGWFMDWSGNLIISS